MKSSKGKENVKVESGDVVFVSDSEGAPEKASGRPNCLSAQKVEELLSVYYSRPYSLRRLAGMFGVSRMTVWRAVQANPGFLVTG